MNCRKLAAGHGPNCINGDRDGGEIMFLGVTITNNMSCSNHIEATAKKTQTNSSASSEG